MGELKRNERQNWKVQRSVLFQILTEITLWEKYQTRRFSGPFFPISGLNTEINPYSVWILKDTDQKKTLNSNTFRAAKDPGIKLLKLDMQPWTIVHVCHLLQSSSRQLCLLFLRSCHTNFSIINRILSSANQIYLDFMRLNY